MHRSEMGGRPLLDIGSYARHGPGRRDRISPAEIEQIRRTVTRTPEVMVKVLTRGGQNLKAVKAHFEYLNRQGALEIETDQGERLAGNGVAARLVKDWDLDLGVFRRRSELRPKKDRAPPKLVHKVLFSMPPGTSAEKVLAAVKNFAREEFRLRHKYAMVLHTDEPHPHVHLVVKAVSEEGVRLNIRKATLRRWRNDFAAQLRALGVAANATERAVRGNTRPPLSDEVYRTRQRGGSWALQERLARNLTQPNADKRGQALEATRNMVHQGWLAVGQMLRSEERYELAARVDAFLARMPSRTGTEEQGADRIRQTPATRWRDDSPVR